MKKERYHKICPQCGSTNVKMPPAGMDIRMTFQDYCEDCENRGMFPEVEESKIEGFKKKLSKE